MSEPSTVFPGCHAKELHVNAVCCASSQAKPISSQGGRGVYIWDRIGAFGDCWFRTSQVRVILLMAEIPNNHPGCMKPCEEWDKLPTSTADRRISAIFSAS